MPEAKSSRVLFCKSAAALLCVMAALCLQQKVAGAAPLRPGSDAFCKAMMDDAARIWPLDQVQACRTWRQHHLEALQNAARKCQAAHRNDFDHPEACDKANDAADRFWEESEYVENNRDVPPEKANPVNRPDR